MHRSSWQRTKLILRPYSTAELEASHADLQKSLPGTVQAHRCLVLLNSAAPPKAFAARHSTHIQRALQLRLVKLGGIVNFAWYGSGYDAAPAATAFTSLNGRLDIPHIGSENIDEVAGLLERHMTERNANPPARQEIHLYVCTHGARDCRCGDTGSKVVQALRDEVAKLPPRKADGPKIRIGEVAHVGGHKYAANLLVYPRGEWLGLVRPEHVPQILSEILQTLPKPLTPSDPPLAPSHWRGRMGLTKNEQIELHSAFAGR